MTAIEPKADALAARKRLLYAIAPTLLFWMVWGLLYWQWPESRWLALTAQMWLAYSAAWLVLPWRWWPLGLPLAAALGGILGQTFIPAFNLTQWSMSFDIAWRGALPATAFALLMHLPLRWWRWREERALALRLGRAEKTAEVAELQRQVGLAELKAMQAQVEPHFLFNALASLQQLIRQQPATAERFVGELHDYLRLALPSLREPLTTVGKELAMARAYLAVMATRLGDRLQYSVQCEPGCELRAVPPMMLLTLVENAVRHGIEPVARGGRIDVDARREGDKLLLEVRDDGAGLQQSGVAAPGKGEGIGLANVRDRLASVCGDSARLRIEQLTTGGVSASIQLSWRDSEAV